MKISVVTVVYNGVRTIEDALVSVLAQSHPTVEHIVIDGVSTDGTLDVLHRYRDRVAKLISEPDGGIYDAMNKGIGLASGDVVGFLNADDFYASSGVLAKVAETMVDPDIDACFADVVYVDRNRTDKVIRYYRSGRYEAGQCQRLGWLPAHPTFFVRRRVYHKFGGFDLEFRRQADFELALRLFDIHGIRSVYVPEIWVRMRMGGLSNNSVLGVIKGNIEAYRACKKNGLNVTPFFVVKKMLSRVPQFFLRPEN